MSSLLSKLNLSTLRTRLVLILAAALSPILIISGMQAYLDGQKNLTLRRDQLLQVADRSIDQTEQSLITSEALLIIFSEQIAAGRCSDVEGWLKPQIPILSNVVHFDANGISQCSAEGESGYPMNRLEWNDKLKAGVETLRTDAFYGEGAQEWMFAVLHRLEIDGEYVGSSAFGMRVETLISMLNQARLPADVSVALVDDELQTFGNLHGVKLKPEWIRAAANSDGGVLFITEDDRSKSVDVVISKVGPGGVYAAVSRPSPGVFADLTLRPVATVGLPLLAFSVALLSVWLAIDSLVLRWLRKLQRLSRAYGRGAYGVQPGESFSEAPEEISNLATSMNQMSERIGERSANLEKAVRQRDDALKEIHHRVKNNLQIVTSFLNLQSRRLEDPTAKEAIAASRHRIDALSVVHQTLYQYEQLDVVRLSPFFKQLLDHLREALGLEDMNIKLVYDVEDMLWAADDAIPLALFVVEAITNATKYAFGPDGGTIDLTLKPSETGTQLIIQDDGRGNVPPEQQDKSGLGRQLKAAFARQLGGSYKVETAEGKGYKIILDVPIQEIKTG